VKRDAVIGIEMNVLYPCYNFEIVTYINFGFKLKALMAFYDFTPLFRKCFHCLFVLVLIGAVVRVTNHRV
jgi:hypothetical protein